MRAPEGLDDITSARVSKICTALEHATHAKCLAVLMVDADNDPYLICRPGYEATVASLLSHTRWDAMKLMAEEWQS